VRVSWVELRDFRNHRHTKLGDVPEGLVLVVGPNGEGKTNLLEALAFLFFLASPRTASAEPLVARGAEAAYVRGEIGTAAGRVLVEVEIPARGASRAQVNRSPVRRRRDLRRQVRAVFSSPEDLAVVSGEPGARRAFLDEAIRALWPLKEGAITAFERALRQRNRWLKDWDGRGPASGLEIWDAELARTGAALTRLRRAAAEALAPGAETAYRCVAGYGLQVRYAPSVEGEPLEERFLARLAERRDDELLRRTTLVGPHRDDLSLAVRDLGARSFASHGEAWAAAVCLRLGLAEAVAGEIGEAPVVLLDDPYSALDPARRERLSGLLHGRGQVFVSAADPEHVPGGAAAVWSVRAGTVEVLRGA
jgi:DNA replication and repair protein RecF